MTDWLTKTILRYDADFQRLTINQADSIGLPINEILTTPFYKVVSRSTSKYNWLSHTWKCNLCGFKAEIPSISPKTVVDIYITLLESFIKTHWGCNQDRQCRLFEEDKDEKKS